MSEIGWKWMPASFGSLPAGAVFRVDKADAGLFIKLEHNASPTGNAVVIVSSGPGNWAYVQAGEITDFRMHTPVEALVREP